MDLPLRANHIREDGSMAYQRVSRSDRIFDIVVKGFFLLFLLVILYPLYFIVIASFSNPKGVINGNVLFWVKDLYLRGYSRIFSDQRIGIGYFNTIRYTALATALNVSLTMLMAYPLSRKDFALRKLLMFLVTFTMFFGGGLIPTYLLVRDLGLLGKWPVMIVMGAVSAWNVIIARTFFQSSIPGELIDSAKVDGCGDFLFFFRILLPLSGALISLLVIYYGVGHWNSYFTAMIYLRDAKLHPLQLILREILVSATMDNALVYEVENADEQIFLYESIKYCMIVISTLPMMIVYPFMQKYFEKGVMIGSLKG
jgi:putative aldouronate transport system permease protein